MKMEPIKLYFLNALIAIDQLLNAVFFLGDPDETISGHIGRVKRANGGIPRKRFIMRGLDWFLELLDKNHTIEAIEEDEGAGGLIDRP